MSTDASLPRLRSRSSSPSAARSQAWRDWAMFALAYGVIVMAIVFAAPPEGRHAGISAAATMQAATR